MVLGIGYQLLVMAVMVHGWSKLLPSQGDQRHPGPTLTEQHWPVDPGIGGKGGGPGILGARDLVNHLIFILVLLFAILSSLSSLAYSQFPRVRLFEGMTFLHCPAYCGMWCDSLLKPLHPSAPGCQVYTSQVAAKPAAVGFES